MIQKQTLPPRFYSLDILRGVAALSVVLFHWRHFFIHCANRNGFQITQQPGYNVLYFFYETGDKAVELFFTLSGFIFFWLYSRPINNRKISFRDFSILRLSRLYPLHFITLLIIFLLQTIYYSKFTCYFIYEYNDLYHFVLQLFFASNWGFQKGFSFNGPIWSVSIEVLLYILFFAICWFRKDKVFVVLTILAGSYAVFYYKGYPIAQGVFSFFVGGLVYKILHYYFDVITQRTWSIVIWMAAGLAWIITLLEFHEPVFKSLFSKILALTSVNSRYIFLYDRLSHLFIVAAVFPVTILALSVWETQKGAVGKRLSFLGDLSYSSYLLHVPLQLVAVLLVHTWGYPNAVFKSPVALLLYFLILIGLSLLSHRYFEMPAQNFLRRKFIRGKNR